MQTAYHLPVLLSGVSSKRLQTLLSDVVLKTHLQFEMTIVSISQMQGEAKSSVVISVLHERPHRLCCVCSINGLKSFAEFSLKTAATTTVGKLTHARLTNITMCPRKSETSGRCNMRFKRNRSGSGPSMLKCPTHGDIEPATLNEVVVHLQAAGELSVFQLTCSCLQHNNSFIILLRLAGEDKKGTHASLTRKALAQLLHDDEVAHELLNEKGDIEAILSSLEGTYKILLSASRCPYNINFVIDEVSAETQSFRKHLLSFHFGLHVSDTRVLR